MEPPCYFKADTGGHRKSFSPVDEMEREVQRPAEMRGDTADRERRRSRQPDAVKKSPRPNILQHRTCRTKANRGEGGYTLPGVGQLCCRSQDLELEPSVAT